MLTGPSPPLLAFGLYFSALSDADALALLIEGLVRQGARFTGQILAFHEVGARDMPFASPTDLLSNQSKVEQTTLDYPALKRYLTDRNVRVLQVGLVDAIGLTRQETAGFTFISPEAVGVDMHPLAIRTAGGFFSAPGKRSATAARKYGARVYARFLALVQSLDPAYAAITIEYSLECPTDLRHDPRSYAFRDCFINEQYVGIAILRRAKNLFADAYVEILSKGLYVSCSSPFNPMNMEVDSESAISKSVAVAKLIASIN